MADVLQAPLHAKPLRRYVSAGATLNTHTGYAGNETTAGKRMLTGLKGAVDAADSVLAPDHANDQRSIQRSPSLSQFEPICAGSASFSDVAKT